MFEQSVLENSQGARRAFATGAGFAGQAALAGLLVIAPLVWPQVLPQPHLALAISQPPPPRPLPPDKTLAVRPREPQSPRPLFDPSILIPTHVPPRAQMLADEAQPDVGVVGSVPSGAGTPGSLGVLDHLLNATPAAPKPSTAAAPAKPAAEEVKRIHVSSLEPGRLIHRVEPVYPPIAKSARISGTVELQAVIGTDGRVRELRVLSGHPLLRQAAVEAVRQWVYQPPILNGQSVEIVAPIAVIFRMN